MLMLSVCGVLLPLIWELHKMEPDEASDNMNAALSVDRDVYRTPLAPTPESTMPQPEPGPRPIVPTTQPMAPTPHPIAAHSERGPRPIAPGPIAPVPHSTPRPMPLAPRPSPAPQTTSAPYSTPTPPLPPSATVSRIVPDKQHEQIVVSIASYRDPACSDTIASLFARAKIPTRIRVAVVDQQNPGDIPCDAHCPGPLCAHRSQIRRRTINATESKGPTHARHLALDLYTDEEFVLQIDSHVKFVRDWDVDILDQWHSIGNDHAVISTYMSPLDALNSNGTRMTATRPVMCKTSFLSDGNIRHLSQPEMRPAIDRPQLQPFWGAGFSFSAMHFMRNVPYDCCTPYIFQGEEISISARGWTHGYDFYAPVRSVAYHDYSPARKKGRRLFWENEQDPTVARAALRRLQATIGLIDDASAIAEAPYGLGNRRTLEDYYRFAGLNVSLRRVSKICPYVLSGKMDADFQPFLRPSGLDLAAARVDITNRSLAAAAECPGGEWCIVD